MNILLITSDRVMPQSGGIARTTYLLADALRLHKYKCFSAYLYPADNATKENIKTNVFEKEYLLQKPINEQQFYEIISANRIDFVILQSSGWDMVQLLPALREATNQNSSTKIIYAFHTKPGQELTKMDCGVLFYRIFKGQNLKVNIRQLIAQTISPVVKKTILRKIQKKYSVPLEKADKIVLLSDEYISAFNHLASSTQSENDKFAVIPNMLVYTEEQCRLVEKEKTVLIVARMNEHSKRIKTALTIWAKTNVPDWQLVIVGDGEDLPYYKRMVKRQDIKNVHFLGSTNPLPYYSHSSLFMMTSAYEGWPMTLLEAMQNGCVPIVFSTFSSAQNIITSSEDGFIVKEGDTTAYADKLSALMTDDELRNKLSMSARKSVYRFSSDKIIAMWENLFDSLTRPSHI